MYCEHFRLKDLPFSLTPNTHYFLNVAHFRDALNTALMALEHGEGFIKITGDIGTGKTLICRKLVQLLDPAQYEVIYLSNPNLSVDDLYRTLALVLGIPTVDALSRASLLDQIQTHLFENPSDQAKKIVLILDEAQAMPLETLEALRLLANIETEEKKLLQIVLVGQTELDRKLATADLRQLLQRIGFHATIPAMSAAAVRSYVEHRLMVAGAQGETLFTPAAIQKIYGGSHGIPRVINILAHKAMLAAFGAGDKVVTPKHVAQAIGDTECAGAKQAVDWLAVVKNGMVVFCAILAIQILYSWLKGV